MEIVPGEPLRQGV